MAISKAAAPNSSILHEAQRIPENRESRVPPILLITEKPDIGIL
jgi:hypothetical protein